MTGMMVAEPDLVRRSATDWPNYTPAALDLGACAVFAFPLQSGAGIVGVLTLYNDTVGMLSDDQAADGHVLSRLLPSIMSTIQAQASHSLLAGELSDTGAYRAEVHQASGVVAVQLGVGVDEALVRMRAHAYVTGETVAQVAREILAHRLYLDDDGA